MFISFSHHKRSLKASNKVKNKYEEIESVMNMYLPLYRLSSLLKKAITEWFRSRECFLHTADRPASWLSLMGKA